MPQQNDPARTPDPSPSTCSTCERRPAAGTWRGHPTCRRCHARALDAIEQAQRDSWQLYRTTDAAQRVARRLHDEPITPQPPTAQIRVYETDGRTVTIQPLADALYPRTRATLHALKGGRANGR